MSPRDRVGDRSRHVGDQGGRRCARRHGAVAGRGVDSGDGDGRWRSRARSGGVVGERDGRGHAGTGRCRQPDAHRDRSGQPGRDRDGMGSIDGSPEGAGDRLARPPRRGDLRPSPRACRTSWPSTPVCNSIRTSSRRSSCGSANRSAIGRRSPPPTRGCCIDSAVPSPPMFRPPAVRCCSISTPAGWSSRACEIFGIDPATLPTVVGNADQLGYCDLFGGSVPVTGTCVDQQAALFAEHVPRGGRGQVHLRHRSVHVGLHR